MTGRQAREWILPVAVLAGGFILWKFGAAPLLESFGLKDSQADKDRIDTENLPANKDYWSPYFIHQTKPYGVSAIILTTRAYALQEAENVWDSKGIVNDNEEKLYGVFRALKYKSQISFLADVFKQQYSRDLYQFIRSFLNDSEMSTLLTITNKKPWGFVKKDGKIY
jgi:hypothetical protein